MAKLYNLAGMSTATTGTGTITLGSAMYGHLTFAQAGVADGDTVTYAIKDGAASEIGRGVYTASGTTLTRTPLKSTNSNSAINLSGSAEVFITPAAEDIIEPPTSSVDGEIVLFSGMTGDVIKRATTTGILKGASGVLSQATAGTDYVAPGSVRELLSSSRTYYVRKDGSDSNSGLSDTSGGAFLTVQKAVNVAAALDLSVYSATVQVRSGTYEESVSLRSYVGAGPITIKGDSSTPANVIIRRPAGGHCVTAAGVVGAYVLDGLKLTTAVEYGLCIYASSGSRTSFKNIDFGGCTAQHVYAESGASVQIAGNYNITGGATNHFNATTGGLIYGQSYTITLTGTPGFSSSFASADRWSGLIVPSLTFSGSATGVRYYSQLNSVIYTGGAGASYFPGNSAGSTATGGQYD